MKRLAGFKVTELYVLASTDGLMAGCIKIDECFSQIKVVILNCYCCLSLLFGYLVDLLLEEHFDSETLFADLNNRNVRLDQINGAFVTVVVLSLMDVFEYSSLFGMVEAGQCSKATLLLDAVDELPIDVNDVWPAFEGISLIYAFFGPCCEGVVGAVVSHVLGGSWSGHLRDELLLFFHGSCDLALEGVLVAKVGLHFPDHGGRSLIHIF
jgi:hypothetical protein